jgi:hypothetical protein
METNSNNGHFPPNDTRMHAISFLWNQLKTYRSEGSHTTEEELLYDTKNLYNELDVIPEMFDVCTKLQKLEYQPVASPEYKHDLVEIMMEAMEVLQSAPN